MGSKGRVYNEKRLNDIKTLTDRIKDHSLQITEAKLNSINFIFSDICTLYIVFIYEKIHTVKIAWEILKTDSIIHV